MRRELLHVGKLFPSVAAAAVVGVLVVVLVDVVVQMNVEFHIQPFEVMAMMKKVSAMAEGTCAFAVQSHTVDSPAVRSCDHISSLNRS